MVDDMVDCERREYGQRLQVDDSTIRVRLGPYCHTGMGAKREDFCWHGSITHGLRNHFGTREENVEILDTYGAGKSTGVLEFIFLPRKHDVTDEPQIKPFYVGQTFQSVVNDEPRSTEYHILRNSGERIIELEIKVTKF